MYSFIFFSVKTDLLKDSAISRLYIAFASKGDTGNYTCSMRNAQASVFVHILDGKYLKACDLQKDMIFHILISILLIQKIILMIFSCKSPTNRRRPLIPIYYIKMSRLFSVR